MSSERQALNDRLDKGCGCVVCKSLDKITQLEADLEALKRVIADLAERAERVQDGEDWDLAEFILRKRDALLPAEER